MLQSIFWDVDPVVIKGFFLRWYSLMFALGFFLPYLILSKKIFPNENRKIEELDKLTMYAFIGGLIGARFGHYLFYEFDEFISKPLEVLLPVSGIYSNGPIKFVGYQGLASHGGALGLAISFYIASRKMKLNYVWIIARVSLIMPLAGAFIRLGNLFNSEIYGHETDLPWGFVFHQAGETVAKHPTQLYEALSYLAIFGLLLWFYKKYFKNNMGFNMMLIGLMFTPLFLSRFLIELVKENQVAFENNYMLNMGQILSIPFIIAGILLLWYGKKKLSDPEKGPDLA